MEIASQHDSAFHRVKLAIDKQYPRGWFVAITEDRILAAAADFQSVEQQLRAQAIDPRSVLVAQSGVEYPDTGSPCAVILGYEDLGLLSRAGAAGVQSNFGELSGGWLQLGMPELGLQSPVLGFGSDHVLKAVKAASAEFRGLVGLPLLRQVEYGGDDLAFWLRQRGPGSSSAE